MSVLESPTLSLNNASTIGETDPIARILEQDIINLGINNQLISLLTTYK